MRRGGREEHKHTAELVDFIIRCFFLGKGRVGLVEGFGERERYIWYVTYPLLIFEAMMMMMMMILLLAITCRICT